MFWLIRQALKLVLLGVLVVAGFVAWALLWPAPSRPRPLHCPPGHSGCAVASGRVLYHTAIGHGRRAHIVLISGASTTLPGIVAAEFPAYLDFTPKGLGFGDWVRISGAREIGSHHEHDIHISFVATSAERVRCGVRAGVHLCRRNGWSRP